MVAVVDCGVSSASPVLDMIAGVVVGVVVGRVSKPTRSRQVQRQYP